MKVAFGWFLLLSSPLFIHIAGKLSERFRTYLIRKWYESLEPGR